MEHEYTPIEEIQDMVGKIPPRVVRYGNIVILCILLVIIGICCMIPVQDTVDIQVVLRKNHDHYDTEAVIPPTGYGNLHIGQTVQINLDCFPSTQYGHMYGQLTALDSVLTDAGYRVKIRVPLQQPSLRTSQRLKEMTGTGMIVVQEQKLIEKIFRKGF